MAKGSFNGVIKGKKGNTVFYELTNSNNKEKQGWREYKASIANPQSDGQIDQRVKMQAVNNLYRALKPIITRGWENHKYGDPSRRAFMKKALGRTFTGPYLEKGSTLAVPIEGVPIMYGSLTPVVLEVGTDQDAVVNCPHVFTADPDMVTIGEVSTALIEAGLAVDGDQFTIIYATVNLAGSISYYVRSFFVNESDTNTMWDTTGIGVISTMVDGQKVMAFQISAFNFQVSDTTHAVLCSISRDGDGSHLRSAAEFSMTSNFKTMFYGNAAQQVAAKASYRKTKSGSTNWEQVPGGEGGGVTPGTGQEAVTNDGVTRYVTALTSTGTGNNYRILMPGSLYVRGVIREGASDTVVYLCDSGVTTQQAPADAANANTVNACSSTNVDNGLRQWLIDNGVNANQLVID